MASISVYLQKILDAVYGEEVRSSIHDAIVAMNEESSNAMQYAKTAKDSAANSATAAADSAKTATDKANAASSSANGAQTSESNAAESANTASQKATAAETAANKASSSEKNAQTSASNAANSAATANQKAIEATNSASAAAEAEKSVANAKNEVDKVAKKVASDKTAAESAKDAAEGGASFALQYAQTALTALNEAQTAARSASSSSQSASAAATAAASSEKTATDAASEASTSAESASKSAESAKQYSGKPPKIQNGTWWIWDAESGDYYDTHMTSEIPGPQGVSITNIQLTEGDHSPGTIDIYTISMSDGSSYTVTVWNGRNGEGVGDVLGISFNLVIPRNAWADNSATISDSRFVASGAYKYFVDADESCRYEYLNSGVGAKDVTTSGYITFINNTDPDIDLTVNILRLKFGANKEP